MATDQVSENRSSRRHLLGRTAALFAGTALGGAAACGSQQQGAAQQPKPAITQPATVSFLGRAPGVYEQTFVDLVKVFQERNRTITISYAHVPPTDNFDQKYQTLIAAGQQPDVFFSSNAGFKQYVSQGHVHFLDEFVKKDRQFKESDYEPYWLELPKYKGRLSALPYDPGNFILFVNKNHLQKAGVRMFDSKTPMAPVFNGEQTARQAITAAMPEINKVLSDSKARMKV